MNPGAIVIGGGVGGLNAACQLAELGHRPVVVEARGRCGGLVVGAPLAGSWIDIGAESYARRSAYCADLCHGLGLETREPGGRSWVQGADDRVFPLPHGVLGIPTDLADPQVVAVLSAEGWRRASEDARLGAAGADRPDLASLVRLRLGEEVYQRLVRPVASGIYSAEPEDLTTDVVVPGLRAALAETGSLVAAAARLRAAAPAGAVVSSVVGGLFRLPQAMAARIESLGGSVRTRTIVTAITRDGDEWVATCRAAGPGATPADPPVPTGEPWQVRAPRVVVAADGRVGIDLLRPLSALGLGDWTLPVGAKVAHVVLAVRQPELDAAPRGSGLLVAPRGPASAPIGAKALTHLSVKWPWLWDDQSGPDKVHYLRVSYGRPGEDPHPTVADGLADASVLLGVSLDEHHLAGSMIVHWNDSLPPPTPEHRERVAGLFERAADLPGLGVTGAWVAGNGLASVLTHAHGEAHRIGA